MRATGQRIPMNWIRLERVRRAQSLPRATTALTNSPRCPLLMPHLLLLPPRNPPNKEESLVSITCPILSSHYYLQVSNIAAFSFSRFVSISEEKVRTS